MNWLDKSELVKEDDFLANRFPADGALGYLVSTELAGSMTTKKGTVFPAVHANLAQ